MAKRFIIGLFALAGLAACTPSQPATPTFAEDVQPIMVAHCTRCHGAGGLQGDKASTSPAYKIAPIQGFFQNYADQGDCTQTDGGSVPTYPTCIRGVAWYVTVNAYVWNMYVPALMPPPPAAPLNDYELEVLNRWKQNPICGSGPLCSGGDGSVD
jgi:hypothetical protein